MSARPSPWPEFYSDLLPNVLFAIADKYPSATYAEFPRDPKDISKGYWKFTFADVANAVNATAWWINQNVGKLEEEQKNGSQTLVYMGPSDIRYALLCLGSVIAGYKMLFPSPRYGAEALVKLIEAIDAKVLLSPETPYPIEAEILKNKKDTLRKLQLPNVDHFFSGRVTRYPFAKTFDTCKDEPMICLQGLTFSNIDTSGTTGFPKPIIWTHDWVASQSRALNLPPPAGFDFADALLRGGKDGTGRVLITTPPYHASGIFSMVFHPLLLGTIPTYSQPGSTPEKTVDRAISALEVLEAGRGGATETTQKVINLVSAIPPCMEYVAKHPSKLDQIAQKAQALRYGGGSISRAAGDTIAQTMHLVCGIGATELGTWSCIRPIDDDLRQDGKWEYLTPHPAINMQFEPAAKDAAQTVYEAILVRNNGEEFDGFVQSFFKIHPDLEAHRTGDLFVRHPKYPDMWKHHGRADDLLVFLSNEKFFPTVAEQRLASHPGIAEALIVGTRRPKAALIVRLENGLKLDDVWDKIEEVNAGSPLYARVEKNMVVVAEEPFLKTAKGSIRKVEMLRKYSQELDALYGETV
ncbi:hypothetical protein yc1106_00749 [Curvularia clavata]|uniref:AMP-dependent synthetase/ligase domain-containing protein n=1 Tax=Curvularia clavata TaxID=95742 RepID=A0A9Q8Z1L4_CURCL|nr:hypothetical protein yc1106_00749 [Curvularia clavata]